MPLAQAHLPGDAPEMREFILLPIYVLAGLLAISVLAILATLIAIGGMLLVALAAAERAFPQRRTSASRQISPPEPWWIEDAECYLAAENAAGVRQGGHD